MDEGRRKHLLRRVGKLFAQAEGTTFKEEAETALLMAQKILAENGMTMAEVNALSAEQQKAAVANEEFVDMGFRHSDWLLSLARVICPNFRCRHYISHRWVKKGWDRKQTHNLRMVGLTDDVAVARDVYNYARTEAERLAKAYAKKPGVVAAHLRDKHQWWWDEESATPAQKAGASREIQRIWLDGFCEGLALKFSEQVKRSESLALILVIHPVVQSAYKDLHLGTSTFRPSPGEARNAGAARDGFQAGHTFEPVRPQRIASPLPRLGSGR